MSFQAPPNQPDFSKLDNLLNQSKMQSENPALYQYLKNLRTAISQMQALFVANINTLNGLSPITGEQGIMGPPGMDGRDGEDGFFTFGINGLPGSPGAIGPAGVTGSPGADGIDGIDGIDGFSIVGPAGGPGPTGLQGPTGAQGIPGNDGLDGLDGMDGLSIVGPTGPQGIQGIQGIQGPIGYGFDGLDGLDGYDGLQGPQGPPGPTGASGSGNAGTTTLDFGAFPGKSDASVDVTGQAAIIAGSVVQAWLRPEDTVDHKADEHMVETMAVFAGNIIAGTGFTIYGFNYSQINEPVIPALLGEAAMFQATATSILAKIIQFGKEGQLNLGGGRGTRIYGTWKVAWRWS